MRERTQPGRPAAKNRGKVFEDTPAHPRIYAKLCGERPGTRTPNLVIKSHLLCQLS
jgi:hypothetical protein